MNALMSAHIARIWMNERDRRPARPAPPAAASPRHGARRLRWVGALVVAVAACWLLAAQASAYVYWTSYSAGNFGIGRANIDGTAPNGTFIGTQNSRGVAVDGRHVYWINYGGSPAIGRANLDGSGVNQNFIPIGGYYSVGLAVDGGHIYWANLFNDGSPASIGRANLDGSGVNQRFITTGGFPNDVAVDGQHVYWANSVGTIGRSSLDGTSVDGSFITGASAPRSVAVDGQHVFWSNLDTKTIGRSNLDGTGVNQTFVTTAASPDGVAVDGRHVFWVNLQSGAIGRANPDGTGVDQSFVNGGAFMDVAVDAGPAGTPTPSPASLDMGTQPPGTFSSPHPLTVRNTGHGDLHLGQVQVAGANPDDFLLSSDGCSHKTLAIGDSCSVGIRFGPSATGVRSATLAVPSDDPASPLNVPLSGTGAPPTHTLTIAKSGAGSGTVSSDPAGIDCGGSCSYAYDDGNTVTLTATPASGSSFSGWSGGSCSGTGPCVVNVGSDTTVTAAFTPEPPPETTIDAGPGGTTRDPTPTFSFSSSEPGSTFECRIDSGGFVPCSSPKTLAALPDGSHTFAVRASDGGATDSTPASRTFTVSTAAVAVSGITLTVTAVDGVRDNLRITRPSAQTLQVSDLPGGSLGGSGVHAGAGCVRAGDAIARCSTTGIQRIRVLAGDQTDQVLNSTAIPSSVNGGGGADVLTGGSSADSINGGAGADTLKGMGGDDTLFSRDAASEKSVDCGSGAHDRANADALPRDPAAIVNGCETVARG